MSPYRDSVSLVRAVLDLYGGHDSRSARETLARKLGVSYHTVRRWVYGDRRPDFKSTMKLFQMIEDN